MQKGAQSRTSQRAPRHFPKPRHHVSAVSQLRLVFKRSALTDLPHLYVYVAWVDAPGNKCSQYVLGDNKYSCVASRPLVFSRVFVIFQRDKYGDVSQWELYVVDADIYVQNLVHKAEGAAGGGVDAEVQVPLVLQGKGGVFTSLILTT